MSKTFDEGGAKGLLLANLGVSSNGCNIVFDSTLEDSTEESKSPEESDKSQESVNVSSLEAALETLLSGQAIEEPKILLTPETKTMYHHNRVVLVAIAALRAQQIAREVSHAK